MTWLLFLVLISSEGRAHCNLPPDEIDPWPPEPSKPEPKPDPIPEPEPKPKPEPEPTYPQWQEIKPLVEYHCAISGCHDGNSQTSDHILDEKLFLSTGSRRIYATSGREMPPLSSPRFGEYAKGKVKEKILLYLKGKGCSQERGCP